MKSRRQPPIFPISSSMMIPIERHLVAVLPLLQQFPIVRQDVPLHKQVAAGAAVRLLDDIG